jgi:hypothetical protein
VGITGRERKTLRYNSRWDLIEGHNFSQLEEFTDQSRASSIHVPDYSDIQFPAITLHIGRE